MARNLEISAEEAIATLVRTSLPTVISEGDDDFLVLRGIEERCSDLGVSIFPVGGKAKALEVWKGLPADRQATTMVAVDRDMWIFVGTPAEYQVKQVIETSGYSIENDLRSDWNWEMLMTGVEREQYHIELAIICKWFVSRVEKWIAGLEVTLSDHPNAILNKPEQINQDAFKIEEQYTSKLRGKTMLELAVRQLSAPNRAAKHSKRSLMEMAASQHGPNLQRIETRIRNFFDAA